MCPPVFSAEGVGTSGGLSLIKANGARPFALGNAFTASENDIMGFAFNPASLRLLQNGQASFLFQKGIADDAFGYASLGGPVKNAGLGLSVGYYDSGEFTAYNGTTQQTVTAQRDLTVSAGGAIAVKNMQVGLAGKYLSSELVEAVSGRAYAADAGVSLPLPRRFRLGAALQNIGTQIKYRNEKDPLPRIGRIGLSHHLPLDIVNLNFFADAPYFMNEKEWRPGAGIEASIGILALRAGYNKGTDLEKFSLGTGFLLGKMSLDYAFGLVDDLDSRHLVSLTYQFGQEKPAELSQWEDAPRRPVYELAWHGPPTKEEYEAARTHHVVKGDTLWDLAERWFGSGFHWPLIHEANKESIEDPHLIEIGQKIRKPDPVYAVKEGDTLWDLAERWYGSGFHWPRIYEVNKGLIKDPHLIDVGQVIHAP